MPTQRGPTGLLGQAEAGETVLAGPWADAAKTAASEVWGLIVLGIGNVPAMVIRIVKTGGYVIEAIGVVIESKTTWKVGEKIRTAADVASILRDVKRILRNDYTAIKVLTRATRSAVKVSDMVGAGGSKPTGGFGPFKRKLYRPRKPGWMTDFEYRTYLKERWIPYGEMPPASRPEKKVDYSNMTTTEELSLVCNQPELYVELQKKGVFKVGACSSGQAFNGQYLNPGNSILLRLFCHKGIAYPASRYFGHQGNVYDAERYELRNGIVLDKKAKGTLI
jgi:hypothetical protein